MLHRRRQESCPANRNGISRRFQPGSSPHPNANARNGGNGRSDSFHHRLHGSFNVLNLGIQSPNQPNRVLQFERLGRHGRADRATCLIPKGFSHSSPIASFGSIAENRLQVRHVRSCYLPGAEKLTEKRVNRRHMQCDTSFSSSGNRIVTRRGTDCFIFARSFTLSNLYLVSDFNSSLCYAVSV